MVEPSETRSDPGGRTLEDALDERLVTVESGNYERNLAYMVGTEFVPFVRDRGAERVDDIDVYDCQAWATELHRRKKDPDEQFSASSAHTYYAAIRAFLGWCVKKGYLETNPAERDSAEDELPANTGDADRQFWSRRVRKRFVSHMTAEVDETLDDENADEYDRTLVMRDRALVYLLAYSGLRGAEVFRDYDDPRRDGLRWRDVDLERDQPTIRVLGKTRVMEDAAALSQAAEPLQRYYDQLDPASPEWPVFPVLDKGTITRKLGDDLRDAGYAGDRHPIDVARDGGLVPPAMSIQSARNVVKRHSKAAGLPGDDSDDEYLRLHGARRGLGNELYAKDAELSQDILRHKSIETTHESYREEQIAQRAAEAEEVLSEDE